MRRDLVAEYHLGPSAMAAILRSTSEEGTGPWLPRFEAACRAHLLHGDRVRCDETKLLDRVYDRDRVARALRAPHVAGDDVVRMLEQLMENPTIPTTASTWTLALGDPVWATFAAPSGLRDVNEIARKEPPAGGDAPWWTDLDPSRVRDLLGLGHIYPRSHLVVLRYARPEDEALRYPTVADAGSSPWFRPARHDDPCGVTLDLQTRGRGMPEAVHANVQAAGRLRRIAPLGQVR